MGSNIGFSRIFRRRKRAVVGDDRLTDHKSAKNGDKLTCDSRKRHKHSSSLFESARNICFDGNNAYNIAAFDDIFKLKTRIDNQSSRTLFFIAQRKIWVDWKSWRF